MMKIQDKKRVTMERRGKRRKRGQMEKEKGKKDRGR